MGLISDLLVAARMTPAMFRLVRQLRIRRDRHSGRAGLALRRPERYRDLHRALVKLGPSYVKFGQFFATRPDVVGAELAQALAGLQDDVPPFAVGVARRDIERELGAPLHEVFVSFNDKPVAAASIAQVHRGEIIHRSGSKQAVAIKILRPRIERRFARDIKTFGAVARLLERVSPASRRLRPTAVVATLERSARLELDLRLEGAAMSEVSEVLADHSHITIPTVEWQYTTRRLLTMQWLDGIPISDVAALREAGFDVPALAQQLIQSFVYQALNAGLFHADMHQGNFLVLRDDEHNQRIGMLDFGIIGRITVVERRYLAGILHGFITGSYTQVAELHLQSGYVPPEHSVAEFAQALRAIGEPIRGLPANEISMANLLNQLFEVTELFGMKTQPQLLLLQKTMVVVEGVARGLDPNLNIWTASEPVVAQWVAHQAGAGERLRELADNAAALGRLMSEFVPVAEQLRSRLGDLSASPSPAEVEASPEQEAHRPRRDGVAILVALVALVVAVLGAIK